MKPSFSSRTKWSKWHGSWWGCGKISSEKSELTTYAFNVFIHYSRRRRSEEWMKKPEIFSYTSQQLSGKIVINHNSLKNNIFISATSDVFCTYTKLLTSLCFPSFTTAKSFHQSVVKKSSHHGNFSLMKKNTHK